MRISATVDSLLCLAIFLIHFHLLESAAVEFTNSTATTVFSLADALEDAKGARETAASESSRDSVDTLKETLEQCSTSFNWMCLKLKLARLLEHLTERREIRLFDGISVIKDPMVKETKAAELMAQVARNYPNDPNARLSGYILKKLFHYAQTHYLSMKLIDEETMEQARAVFEAGRKLGKKDGMGVLIAAGLMMKGALIAVGMAGIALIAGKALMAALLALIMSSLVGLKGLGASAGKSHVYEIVTKPLYTSSHAGVSEGGGGGGHFGHSGTGYGGYARALNLKLPKGMTGSENIETN